LPESGPAILPPAKAGTILVVDDEPSLLAVYLRALRQAGLETEGVGDGLAASALLEKRAFDVIVSDVTMPGMDGVHLLRTVRQRNLDVPVILMTGAPALETAMKAVEYGAFRYIVKPFEPEVLIDAVRQAQRLYRIAQLRREAVALLGTESKQLGDLVALETSFERALQTLWMAYQPIVSWEKRKVFAFEALVRTSEPAIPNPGALLDAAERLDRLLDLGRAVRNCVAPMVASAPSECVFVNLHTRDLLDEQLFSPDAPLSKVAERVVLEITERAALDDVPDSRARVTRLRSLGFRIAIDDLGAGYAGLTAFAQLEPEVVKFDMSLIRNLHESPPRQKLVTSMAKLFREMGLRVVAEGVETAAERDAVTAAGCELIQGYLFAKPGKPFPVPQW
jgi:EAL domain-containing protein (putative c-di-GMP-specific phosphodiesterase class I)